MQLARTSLALALLVVLFAGNLTAQKKKPQSEDEGYVPTVAPEGKSKKKKGDDLTQSLPPPPELPVTVSAQTDRLAFQVSPLSPRGLLSQQTRDALKALLRTNHGTILQLRAFVAGSGDLRRVGELVGETFTEKHLPLPALSVVQVGALPQEGAQVVIESTEADRKVLNPNGVAFLSGQAAPSLAQSLDNVKSALEAGGMLPSDALRVTCFVSSLAEQKDIQPAMTASFPGAALNHVQMQRESVTPAVECEAVARLRAPRSESVSFLNPLKLEQPSAYSQVALVTSPELIITGTQLAFGNQDSDLKLAFDRLEKALSSAKTRLNRVVMSHLYVTSSSLAGRVRAVRGGYYSSEHPPASTMLPFEGLPSLDALFGLDVIAVPDSSSARR
jgi:enamine deaminase RidA (YjgF/YER057c/UK114 family)